VLETESFRHFLLAIMSEWWYNIGDVSGISKELFMYIDQVVNSGKPYLRVAESYSVRVNGVRKNRKRTIRNIGPLSRFDDGQPNFLNRLKQSYKDGHPIIPGLDDLVLLEESPSKIKIELDRFDDDAVFSDPKNIGYFFLDALYDALGIYDVLNKYKSQSKIAYDVNGHTKTLVFGRALNPASKCATWRARNHYLFDVVATDNLIEVYRTLDVLYDQSEKIQRRMNAKIEKLIGRSKSVCFYDVTNCWFEIDDPDEDEVCETGEIIKEGLRKRGPSKAKNRKPITQMGLFTDDNGIPVSYKVFPGNHIDQTTLRPAMKETLNKMGFERAIIVADGGLNSGKNLAHIVLQNNGYIVSKSAKGSTKEVKEWILDEAGYIWNEKGTFKLKSKIRTRTIVDEDGNRVTVKEKLISYWSKKQYDYALHENRKFIEYLNETVAHPDKLKDKQCKLQKYLVKTEADKATGEVLDSVTILSLDMGKINQDLGLLGYYTVMTSEIEMADHDVIDKYHGLSRIEAAFRIIKSDLEARPVFVRSHEHINAHFLICFIALTMIRFLQFKVLKSQGKVTNSTRDWEMGLPADRMKSALSDFKADSLPGGYYRLTKIGYDLALIADAIGVDVALRLPVENDLRQLKYQIDHALGIRLQKNTL
jgi:transposase